MELYLLKFSGCLLIFLTFYKLVLEKENMHVFKRFFLLGALVLAIVIPLVTFTQYVEPVSQTIGLSTQDALIINDIVIAKTDINYVPYIIWSVYIIGVLLFGFKFIRNLYQLNHKIKHNPKQRYNKFTHVLLKDLIVPHTFFNYIFFNKYKLEANEIPEEVFWHEQTHASQKHSIDVIFIEALQVLLWFNPLVYIIKHAIKLNHEFLADQNVLRKGINTNTYQEIILAFSSNAAQPQLANAINYSLIKKRFTVMKTKTTKRGIWLRSLILLPLLAIMLYSFSDTKVVERDIVETTESLLQYVTNKEGATEAMMEEYKAYIDSYEESKIIFMGKYNRAVAIYDMMNIEQRESVKKLPKSLPIDLSKKKANKPTDNEINSWKNKSEFAIWIDGKVVGNSVLSDYSSKDFVHYFQSKVYKNARSERFPQPFQVNIYTKKGFENAFLNSNINKYKSQAKEYNDALSIWLKGNQTDNSELRILKAQADKVHLSLSKEEIAKNNILKTPPIPSANSQDTTNNKLNKNWFITINGKKYYYTFNNRIAKYYDEKGVEVKLDIVKEYNKKYTNYIDLKEDNGEHYTQKSEKEKSVIDNVFSDLGGMYFRMSTEDKAKVKRPVSPIKPYIKVTYKNGTITYKKRSELTAEDKENMVIPPPPAKQQKATKAQIKEYNKLAKKYNDMSKDEMHVKKSDMERLKHIYSIMSAAQKKDAEPFPNIPPPPPAPNAPRVIEVEEALPPPPPPIPANATPEQRKKYEKAIKMYKELKDAKAKRMPPSPPPPPIPDNATPEQRKKYEEAIKNYKLAVAKSKQNLARVKEVNDAERAELIKVKEEYATQMKASQEVKLARVAEMKQRQEKLKQEKLQRVTEREVISEERKEQLAKIKLKRVEERQVEIEKRQEKLKKEKLKHVEERQALAEQKREIAMAKRINEQKERVLIREIKTPKPPKSPLDHVIDMAKKDAQFYFEGKEISSDEAIKKLKMNKKMNIRTISWDSNKPKVYLSTKPIVVEKN